MARSVWPAGTVIDQTDARAELALLLLKEERAREVREHLEIALGQYRARRETARVVACQSQLARLRGVRDLSATGIACSFCGANTTVERPPLRREMELICASCLLDAKRLFDEE